MNPQPDNRRYPVAAGERLAEIRAQHAALTPGPWHWSGYKNARLSTGPYLATWIPGYGRTTVMDCVRLGMKGAQPRFNVDFIMQKGVDLAVREVPYRDDIVDIDHPDARFIAAAPQIVADLLDHIDALTAERDALRAFVVLFERWRNNEVTTGDLLVTHDGLMVGEFLKHTAPDHSPSPVEPSDDYRQARGVVDLHGEPAETIIRRRRGE